ncbi:hypothetical protein [Streptococcus pneumoniae]|nr:hypothetical protein [Streptococcus pneumoniae]
MKIKEQTRKLAVGLASGCSKHCFEVVGLETNEVSNLHTARRR